MSDTDKPRLLLSGALVPPILVSAVVTSMPKFADALFEERKLLPNVVVVAILKWKFFKVLLSKNTVVPNLKSGF